MKKIFIILLAVIGFGISVNAQRQCEGCTCTICGSSVYYTSQAYQKEIPCNYCSGDGLVTGYVRETCRECEGTGKIKCQGWESCSSCGGTGCKNGYTTNGGKNCAYGYCTYCNGKGGKYVTGRWTSCNNCSYCRGSGVREVQKPKSTGCTHCGGNSQYAGSGIKYQWQSGCKCSNSRCGQGYTGCN